MLGTQKQVNFASERSRAIIFRIFVKGKFEIFFRSYREHFPNSSKAKFEKVNPPPNERASDQNFENLLEAGGLYYGLFSTGGNKKRNPTFFRFLNVSIYLTVKYHFSESINGFYAYKNMYFHILFVVIAYTPKFLELFEEKLPI